MNASLMKVLLAAGLVTAVRPLLPAAEAPDYLRDVRPILSSHCFKCHGPDKETRKGGVRLDLREEALKEGKSGALAIVPGQPDKSEVIARIFTQDEDDLMPPAKVKHPLTGAQKDILKRWVAAGAEYRPHWAFVAPKAPTPPTTAAHPVDAFIRTRLQKEGLPPSPEADRVTLARRLSLDLTGLPPTPEEADAFAADQRPDAYERLVDRLLASPRYGERWARKWLDLARYADSNGYEKDRNRNIWPYRDWVIRAVNADMPFDQFTLEQLAGDLLPNSTLEQKVATGFHRNTMLNEEGGIDPLEFRFHAVVDRVGTTATTWLGLTMACAQCHTHKYDPILHTDYYKLMAFLNNADEPDLDLPAEDAAEQQRKREQRVTKLISELPSKWPLDSGPVQWTRVTPRVETIATNDSAKVLDDGSVLFASPGPDRADVTFSFTTTATNISQLRLEALRHDGKGPGRTPHGNFVLSEISITQATGAAAPKRVKIAKAMASAQQEKFGITDAFDGKPGTGWAVHEKGKELNVNHRAEFEFEAPIKNSEPTRITVRLQQQHGSQHTMARVALNIGTPRVDSRPEVARREAAIEQSFARWLKRERERTVPWTALRPVEAKSNLPLLTVQPDTSVLASGDISKSDTYDLAFTRLPGRITAIRLEALPDDSLPAHGPGLTYYEGPKGDFFMGEFQVKADGAPVKFSKASESYAKNNFGSRASAQLATDGDPQTGWTCADRPGETHVAVFVPAAPIEAVRLDVKMMFGRHYACSLGKFRISVTTDTTPAEARDYAESIEALLRVPDDKLTAEQRAQLKQQFLLSAPELAEATKEIRRLRKPLTHQTTLVMRERPANAPRPTFLHKRGEYLQPAERMEADVPEFLPQLDKNVKRDRVALAKWLVSPENPLTARVVVNRHWAAFFGRGIVATENDFGFQGELPTHPELLDWLAIEFMKQGWSVKKLHRIIATSATYRQASRVTPDMLERDPQNRLLARGPRARLEAEIIRDSALPAGDVLSAKMFGPPVKPPQPSGVTEAAYGSPKWDASTGEDRYRRSIYTFQKRTAPFAMLNAFDAPSGEACVAKRDVSNTPLQALTLLNDIAFVEAAQKLGALATTQPGSVDERTAFLFRRVMTRAPSAAESAKLVAFFNQQRERLKSGELKPADLAPEGKGDPVERAAWTTVARAVLNLDEAISKR